MAVPTATLVRGRRPRRPGGTEHTLADPGSARQRLSAPSPLQIPKNLAQAGYKAKATHRDLAKPV
jgi:hypothetical protein